MPPRRSAPPVLDIDALRRDLQAGRPVRVQVAPSATFPDGQTGRVRRVGDPERDGNDFIEVEVMVAGRRDVLPFAPADLRPPVRRQAAGRAEPTAATTRTASTAQPTGTEPVPATASPTPTRPTGAEQPRPATASPTPTRPTGAEQPRPATASPTPTRPTGAEQPRPATASPTPTHSGPAPAPSQPPARAGSPTPKARPTATQRARNRHVPVVITVSSTGEPDASWEVAARVGARVAVRGTPVSAGGVWQLVESLDSPALRTAVRGVLEESRRRAEQRAAELAAELDAIRVELDRYPPG